MSVFEYLLGSVGLGLLHVAFGGYIFLMGVGVVPRPRRSPGGPAPRPSPGLTVIGALIAGFGIWMATR